MLKFDYFSAADADQYTFYRIPKILFTDKHFYNLSCEAKVLYGLMLDRISLSIKNKWFDKDGHAYIIFQSYEISKLMGCGKQKAYRMLAELDSDGGIGLIERCRRGLGMANIIYVKNFNSVNYGAEMNPNMPEEKRRNKQVERPDNYHEEDRINTAGECFRNPQSCLYDTEAKGCDQYGIAGHDDQEKTNLTEGYFLENGGCENMEIPEDIQKDEIHTLGRMKSDANEPADIQKDEIHPSGDMNFIHQEVPDSYPNKTYKNNTKMNDTDPILSYPSHPSILSSRGGMTATREPPSVIMTEDEVAWVTVRQQIKIQIGYDRLILGYGYEKERLDEILEIMTDIIGGEQKSMIIGGIRHSGKAVRERFLKLDMYDIQYVFACIDESGTIIHNVKKYMITTLFNAPTTKDTYYRNRVKVDMLNTRVP